MVRIQGGNHFHLISLKDKLGAAIRPERGHDGHALSRVQKSAGYIRPTDSQNDFFSLYVYIL